MTVKFLTMIWDGQKFPELLLEKDGTAVLLLDLALFCN